LLFEIVYNLSRDNDVKIYKSYYNYRYYMDIPKIVDLFQRAINPYRKVIDDKLRYLSRAERREIAAYLLHNEDIIKSYLGKTDPSRILYYITEFAFYKGTGPTSLIVSQYIDGLKGLDRIIKEIRKNGYLPLPKYNNVTKPDDYDIEISFRIRGNSQERKDTLIKVFKIIGEFWARGFPVSYYNGTDNSPIIYYMEVGNDDNIYVRFFIRKPVPPEAVGYLLYRLSSLPIAPPDDDRLHHVGHRFTENRIKIDKLSNEDQYVSEAIGYFRAFAEFF